MSEVWTSAEILRALIKTWLDQATFANFVEFELRTDESGKYTRRVDLLTIMVNGGSAPWTTAGNARGHRGYVASGYRVAFEIKTSRADFITDVRDIGKQAPARKIAHELYFVAPAGVVKKSTYGWYEDLPHGAGLIELARDERKRWLGVPRLTLSRAADVNYLPETPLWFVNQLAHRTLYGRASGGEAALREEKQYPAMASAEPESAGAMA